MRILIDGDGCPVVPLVLKAAQKHDIPVILVWDEAHLSQWPGVETVTVSKGADSADFYIVNRAAKGDVVVTQDYGLAAMCLAKQAYPLHQDGMAYTAQNMDGLLAQRHVAKKIRQGGGRLKGPKKRTPAQDKQFMESLEHLLIQLLDQEKERVSKSL